MTLNFGVRYETTTVLKEVNGKIANLRYITDPKVTTGDPYFNNPTFKNFAPRIGFSWDPFKDGKTAALCSVNGEVWIVSGIDETLEHLTWKRFASGTP